MIDTPIQKDAGLYYRCTQHTMWRLQPSVLRSAATAGNGWGMVARVLLASATVALLLAARRSAGHEPRATANA